MTDCNGIISLLDIPPGDYDGHCHVFASDLPMVANRRYTPEYDAPPDLLCENLRSAMLSGALLIQPSFLGTDNSYLLSSLEQLGNQRDLKFRGVVVIDPSLAPDCGWMRELNQRGAAGVRLNLLGQEEQFRYGDWKRALKPVEELGWHVELHARSQYLPAILPALLQHHARVVVDHFGLIANIDLDGGLRSLLDQPRERLWIKASAAYRVFPGHNNDQCTQLITPLFRLFQDHLGPDRIIWGSDWPFTQYEDQIDYRDSLELRRLGLS
jgi:predicted TIM-barrel fold metal-dependent hydrolase